MGTAGPRRSVQLCRQQRHERAHRSGGRGGARDGIVEVSGQNMYARRLVGGGCTRSGSPKLKQHLSSICHDAKVTHEIHTTANRVAELIIIHGGRPRANWEIPVGAHATQVKQVVIPLIVVILAAGFFDGAVPLGSVLNRTRLITACLFLSFIPK